MKNEHKAFFAQLKESLFPQLQILNTPWYETWSSQLRKQVRSSILIGYGLAATGYVLHYFFVDIPLGLSADSKWAIYRFGLAAAALVFALITTIARFSNMFVLRGLFFVYGCAVCILQTLAMKWYSGVPYFWAAALPILVVLVLRLSVFSSVVLCGIIYSLEFIFLPVELRILHLSTSIVGLMTVCLLRSRDFFEVKIFLIGQEKIEAQKKLYESQVEMVSVAKQVAHDIRSPLSVLSMVALGSEPQTEETKNLIRQSIYRIRDVADDLLNRSRTVMEKSESMPVMA